MSLSRLSTQLRHSKPCAENAARCPPMSRLSLLPKCARFAPLPRHRWTHRPIHFSRLPAVPQQRARFAVPDRRPTQFFAHPAAGVWPRALRVSAAVQHSPPKADSVRDAAGQLPPECRLELPADSSYFPSLLTGDTPVQSQTCGAIVHAVRSPGRADCLRTVSR
jgi:hypothetical protein